MTTSAGQPALGVHLSLPSDFHPIPIPDDGSVPDGPAVREFVQSVFPLADEELASQLATHFANVVSTQAGTSIDLAALCLGKLDERITGAYLTVSLHAFPLNDVLVQSAPFANVLREGGSSRVVALDLPAGPAIVSLRLRTLGLPDSPSGTDDASQDFGLIQIFVQVTDHPALAVITLVTPSVGDLASYARLVGSSAATLRIEQVNAE